MVTLLHSEAVFWCRKWGMVTSAWVGYHMRAGDVIPFLVQPWHDLPDEQLANEFWSAVVSSLHTSHSQTPPGIPGMSASTQWRPFDVLHPQWGIPSPWFLHKVCVASGWAVPFRATSSKLLCISSNCLYVGCIVFMYAVVREKAQQTLHV